VKSLRFRRMPRVRVAECGIADPNQAFDSVSFTQEAI